MMSNLEVVKPIVVNCIEFYVSTNGKHTGVSVSGLAKLSGLASVNTLRTLLKSLDGHPGYTSKQPPKQLESLRGQVFSTLLKGDQVGTMDVEIVDSNAAAKIITYYAYVSKSANDVAKFSLEKFTAIGIDAWIKQVVGYTEPQVNNPVQAPDLTPLLQNILSELQATRQVRMSYYNIKDTVKYQPGLNDIISSYEQGYLLADGQQFTLQTWLKAKGVSLSHSVMTRLGSLVGRTYEVHHRRPAPKMCGSLLGNRHCGLVNVYTAEDIPLLESALKTCLSGAVA